MHAVLADVQTSLLVFRRNSQEANRLEAVEQNEHRAERPCTDNQGRQSLDIDVAATGHPLGNGCAEQACCKASPNTTHAVDGEGTDGIVDLQLVLQHDAADHQGTGNSADDKGTDLC